MMKFSSKKQKKFLDSLSLPSLEDDNNDLTIRCKFNFSYFDSSQNAGQKFSEWSHKQLCDLLGKLKDFTTQSLDSWRQQRAGKGGLKILEIYGDFPLKSKFVRPKYIPHQVQWGRFRLGYETRLAGFVIPPDLHKTPHNITGEFFDKNTFYVVFLDQGHKFYLTERK